MLEPVGRNSAPAIAAAAMLVAEEDPDAVLWMMAADASIADESALQTAVQAAAAAARAGYVVTFGMKPTAPETGYGYIEIGAPLPGSEGVHAVARFLEKPDTATAARFVSDGRHLWNSGMFVFTARTLLEELEQHAPDVLPAVRQAVADRTADLDFIRLGAEAFTACPSISIDYAVAERTSRAAVVPADLGWSDVGSWSALWELGDKDERRQRGAGRRGAGRGGELLRPQRRDAGRGGRAEGRGGGGDRGRRAGNASWPRAGREEDRRAAEGRRPAGGGGA